MTFAPLGPPTHKKPKPKAVKFTNDLYGYISADEDLQTGTEIYAVQGENFILVESGMYVLESGDALEIVDGIIQ